MAATYKTRCSGQTSCDGHCCCCISFRLVSWVTAVIANKCFRPNRPVRVWFTKEEMPPFPAAGNSMLLHWRSSLHLYHVVWDVTRIQQQLQQQLTNVLFTSPCQWLQGSVVTLLFKVRSFASLLLSLLVGDLTLFFSVLDRWTNETVACLVAALGSCCSHHYVTVVCWMSCRSGLFIRGAVFPGDYY